MKQGNLVKYCPTSWAMPDRALHEGILGVITDKSGYLWGVQWLGVEALHYHLETDLEAVDENR